MFFCCNFVSLFMLICLKRILQGLFCRELWQIILNTVYFILLFFYFMTCRLKKVLKVIEFSRALSLAILLKNGAAIWCGFKKIAKPFLQTTRTSVSKSSTFLDCALSASMRECLIFKNKTFY